MLIINNLVDIDIKNTPLQLLNTQTRRSLPLTYQNLRPNKSCYEYSFFPCTTPEWNSLPVSVRTSNSLNICKSELNKLNFLDLIAKLITPPEAMLNPLEGDCVVLT